jgi:hypothetical protein
MTAVRGWCKIYWKQIYHYQFQQGGKRREKHKKEEKKRFSELQYHPYVLRYVKNVFWGLITYEIKIFMTRKNNMWSIKYIN